MADIVTLAVRVGLDAFASAVLAAIYSQLADPQAVGAGVRAAAAVAGQGCR